jgi:hypothetical protein
MVSMSELSWQPSDMDGFGDKGIVAVADDYEFHITGPVSGDPRGRQWMLVTSRLSDPCNCDGLPGGMFSDRFSAQRAAVHWAERLVLYGELREP